MCTVVSDPACTPGEVGSAQALVLNASSSRDLDGLTAVPFQFSWACEDASTRVACIRADTSDGQVLNMESLKVGSGAEVRVPPGYLRAGVYQFSVVASKGVAGGLLPNVFRNSRWVM
jgi:hypothetical protein